MDIEQAAEMARLMTGSDLDAKEIISRLDKLNPATRELVCREIDCMVRLHNLPFDKAYPLIRDGFNRVALKYSIDPAVLFWAYMDWRRQRGQESKD